MNRIHELKTAKAPSFNFSPQKLEYVNLLKQTYSSLFSHDTTTLHLFQIQFILHLIQLAYSLQICIQNPRFSYLIIIIMSKHKNQSHSQNISQLVTHQEKQITKNRVSSHKKQNNKNLQLFEEELLSEMNDESHDQNNPQLQKMVSVMNKMIAQRKINNTNAFDFPIIDIDFNTIQGFFKGGSKYFQDEEEEMAWRKISSVLENDSKIYHLRVQQTQKLALQMIQSFCRKDEMFLKPNHSSQEKVAVKKKKIQYDTTELLESQIYEKIKKHLDLSPLAFNSNLAKLMVRKDPTFQKTRRRFDQAGIQSVLMNTLPLSENFELQIHQQTKKTVQNCQKSCDESLALKTDKSGNKSEMQIEQINQSGGQQMIKNKNQMIQIENQSQNVLNNTIPEYLLSQLETGKQNKFRTHYRRSCEKIYKSLNMMFPFVTREKKCLHFQQNEENLWKKFKMLQKAEYLSEGNKFLDQFPDSDDEFDHNHQDEQELVISSSKEKSGKKQKSSDFEKNIFDENKHLSQPQQMQLENRENQINQQRQNFRYCRFQRENIDELCEEAREEFEKRLQEVKVDENIVDEEIQDDKKSVSDVGEEINFERLLNINVHVPIGQNIRSTKKKLKSNLAEAEEKAVLSLFKKQRKIKQVIKMKDHTPKKRERVLPVRRNVSTRKKTVKPEMNEILSSEKKKEKVPKFTFQQNDLFNPRNLLSKSSVLRKQAFNITQNDRRRPIIEKNLVLGIPPINSIFSEKMRTVLIPEATEQDLMLEQKKRENEVMLINKEKKEINEMRINEIQIEDSDSEISQSSSSPLPQVLVRTSAQNYTRRLPPMLKIKQKLLKIIDHTRKLDFKSIYKKYLKTVTKQYEKKCEKAGRNCNQACNDYIIKSKICFIAVLHLANQRGYSLTKIDKNNFRLEFM